MKRLLLLFLLFPFFSNAQYMSIVTDSTTLCHGTSALFISGASIASHPHPQFHWKLNGLSVGTDSINYTATSLHNGDSIICLATNTAGDTVLAVSNSIIMTVSTIPHATAIIAADTSVCVGDTIMLSDAAAGGIWGTNSTSISANNGIVTTAPYFHYYDYYYPQLKVYYAITNGCGTDTVYQGIIVNAIPDASFNVSNPLAELKI